MEFPALLQKFGLIRTERFNELQCGVGTVRCELKRELIIAGCVSVFDGQCEALSGVAVQIKIAVAPGMEV